MIGRRALLAGALAAPALARAQPAGWNAAFAGWAQRHGINSGALAAMRGGRLVHASGLAGQVATARVPVWSLSKFITATAVAQQIGQDRLALDWTLARAMPKTLAAHSLDARAPLARCTLADLLTHRAGLPLSAPTETTARLFAAPPADFQLADAIRATLAVRPDALAGLSYRYSNPGYQLLGLAVAEAAGQPYAAYVAAGVLAASGIRAAAMDPDWHWFDAMGGWRLSPVEYLAVARHVLLSEAVLPRPIRAWMVDPEGKRTGTDPTVFYSLGLFVETRPNGVNFFHTGGWTWRQATRWGAVDVSSGTSFLMAADGTAWCAAYAPNPGGTAVGALWPSLWPVVGRLATDEGDADLFPALLREAA